MPNRPSRPIGEPPNVPNPQKDPPDEDDVLNNVELDLDEDELDDEDDINEDDENLGG